MDKYEKLTEDLRVAVNETKHLEETEDGGTCNFDSPSLALPRWRSDKVEAAVHAAGLHTRKWSWLNRWVISTPSSGQGNRRTRRAEAMCDILKQRGYDTLMYYQMD